MYGFILKYLKVLKKKTMPSAELTNRFNRFPCPFPRALIQ